MKKIFIIMFLFACFSGLILTNCNTPAEKTKKLENTNDSIVESKMDSEWAQEEYLVDVENYRKEMEENISDNILKIAELRAKTEYVKNETKADFKKKIEEMELKNMEMKKKIDEYKVEGKEKWEKFKDEFSHDMQELGKAIKNLTVKNQK